jgi:hypothetical protein
MAAEGLLFTIDVSARLNATLAGLFWFSGVLGLSVPDSRRELLIFGAGYLEIYLLFFLYITMNRHSNKINISELQISDAHFDGLYRFITMLSNLFKIFPAHF